MDKIYLDYAASTPLDVRVFDKMKDLMLGPPGNAGALHYFGARQLEALSAARASLAQILGVSPDELVFTASATEANNLALKGIVATGQGKHIIISAVEHASVYQTAKVLEKKGYEISLLPVDARGQVRVEALPEMLRKDTTLVSVVFVNNETGMLQPVSEIGELCHANGTLFHCDAAQGFARFPLPLDTLPIDLLTLSGHKIYGPMGAAMLYVRSGVRLHAQLHGGGQEEGRRASSVNVAAAVGLAEAAQLLSREAAEENHRLARLKADFLTQIQTGIRDVHLNGTLDQSSPHILNVSFTGCDAEILAMQLDRKGVAVSTGSACSSGKVKVSRVLEAMFKDKKRIRGAIRFSFGRHTTADELQLVAELLPDLVRKVRKIS